MVTLHVYQKHCICRLARVPYWTAFQWSVAIALLYFSPSRPLAAPAMRPDSLPRLWRYINLLLTYLLTYRIGQYGIVMKIHVSASYSIKESYSQLSQHQIKLRCLGPKSIRTSLWDTTAKHIKFLFPSYLPITANSFILGGHITWVKEYFSCGQEEGECCILYQSTVVTDGCRLQLYLYAYAVIIMWTSPGSKLFTRRCIISLHAPHRTGGSQNILVLDTHTAAESEELRLLRLTSHSTHNQTVDDIFTGPNIQPTVKAPAEAKDDSKLHSDDLWSPFIDRLSKMPWKCIHCHI